MRTVPSCILTLDNITHGTLFLPVHYTRIPMRPLKPSAAPLMQQGNEKCYQLLLAVIWQ